MSLLFILVPLVGVILINLPIEKLFKKITFSVGIVISLLQMLMALTANAGIWNNISNIFRDVMPVNLQMGKYSALVLLTIGLITFVSLIVCYNTNKKELINYTSLMLIIMMGMNGVVLVTDLFSLYVFLEIIAVSSFILISIYKDMNALISSYKYFIMSVIASVFMLLGIAMVLILVGDVSFSVIKDYFSLANGSHQFQLIAVILLFITGLSIKAGLVPFHGWLPLAYSNSPSSVSVLLAGIVTKVAGVYSIYVIYINAFCKNSTVGNIIMLFGVISIVIGAFAAIGQSDLKKMLSFSSISQIGYIILAIGIGSPLALLGAFFHFFNHATFKSLLFVNSTAIEEQTGTTKLDDLGGLAVKMKITGGTSVVGFLSTAGIPPLSGFWSKLIIIIAAWQASNYSYAVIALLASILTLAYFLIMQRKVFFGELKAGLEGIVEANRGIRFVSLFLAAIIILVGILFPFLYVYIVSIGLI